MRSRREAGAERARLDEAVALAHARLSAHADVLRLAQTVAVVGHPEKALDLAAWGLSLQPGDEGDLWHDPTSKTPLARWLREAADEAGRHDVTLMAARVAFEEKPCS